MDFEIGKYFMFDENAHKQVKVLVKAMLTPEERLVKMEILPVLLYYNKTIVRLVVFKIKRDDDTFIIDTQGRKYNDFAHWREKRLLPNGKVAFLEKFYAEGAGRFTIIKENVMFGSRRFFQVLDGLMLGLNIASVVLGLLIAPLGPVFLIIGIVTKIYGII